MKTSGAASSRDVVVNKFWEPNEKALWLGTNNMTTNELSSTDRQINGKAKPTPASLPA